LRGVRHIIEPHSIPKGEKRLSDSKNPPKPPPPDDFSETTPNIPVPRDDAPTDWEKTNYNFSPQPSADDWGKTVANYNVPPTDEPDFSKTYLPASQNSKKPDWGMTDENIRLPKDDFSATENFGGREESFGATTPYFRLPEAERAKYENPSPAEKDERQKQEEKNGIPSWVWVSGGLATLFLFFILVLVAVYFLFFNKTGFDVTVRRAPAQSKVFVDGSQWGVSDEDGTIILQGLQSSIVKKIEIKNENYKCEPFELTGKDGEPQEITARCAQISIPLDTKNVNCGTPPKLGEFEKAERCANIALDNLPKPNFSADDLVRALNIFIINFDSGKDDIPPERMAFLKRAAEFIQKLPPSTVLEIGGHTDNVGTVEDNQVLSENRAKAVKDALVRFGVKTEVLQTKGYGETIQKVDNNSEQNRFYNRRIEYSVIKR
jgi:outer membrane protein OmpA-like peptidoglycan-associated protein